MCDVGKELNNAANSISNALGTDGSKNGLLNDPVSMGALAIGTGAYMAGALPGVGAASTVSVSAADTVAATAAADASAAAAAGGGIAFDFSPTIGGVASGLADSVPWSAIGSGALSVGKAVLPAMLSGSGRQAQLVRYPSGYLLQTHDSGVQPYQLKTTYPGASGPTSDGMLPLMLLAALGVLALKG